MEFMIGIQGDGFVLVASDSTSGRSIVRMKDGKLKYLYELLECVILKEK